MAFPTSAGEWLALAERTKAAADQMSGSDARATLLKLAADYERLAEYTRETIQQF